MLDQALEEEPPTSALSSVYARLEGSAALGVLFTDYDLLAVTTNFGSLYTISDAATGLFVFASEAEILRHFAKQARLPLSSRTLSLTRVSPHTGWLVPFDGGTPTALDLSRPTKASPPRRTHSTSVIDGQPHPRDLKRCTRCILPAGYPLLTFDADGVCNHCRRYQPQQLKGKEALERLLSYRTRDYEKHP